MPDNRRPQRNGAISNSSNPSGNNIEGIRRLRIQSNGKQDVGGWAAHSGSYPDRPGEPDCIYYLRTGMCGYGSNCRFNHPTYIGQVGQYGGELPERVGEPDCGYFLKTGTCKYGSTCKYHHPRDRHGAGPILLNMLGLPIRQGEKPCAHYVRTGSCKFGVACKYHHPQPASDETALHVSTGPSVLPSSGAHYIGGLPAWSLPRATYISDPLLQSPQAYMTAVLSPSQGIVPTQGWNTYMGSLSPASATSILGVSGSNGHVYPMASVSQLPERPEQPECRYFMSTGNCKYGSDCKYHHPREKIAQVAASSLGPLGLPLRPGHAVCSYYSLYGLCKYGPTCRFDHPLLGYSYQYSLSLPSLSVLDPSLLPSQRYSPTFLSSESSPSKSLKNTGWIQTIAAGSKGNPTTDTKGHEDSSEHAGSSLRSLSASELPHDQSD